MVHVNAELLAGHALGHTDELDAQQLRHVTSVRSAVPKVLTVVA